LFTSFELRNLRPGAPAPPYVGFDNFARIIDNNIVIPNFDFLRVLVFNLFWALSNVVIHVVLGVAIALILNVEGLKFKRIWRAVYILPVAIPPIIVATVWRNMFDAQYGPVNQIINGTIGVLFKLPPVTLDWLNEPNPIIAAVIRHPFACFALLAAMSARLATGAVVATGALQSVPDNV
jgi:arabinogalactan oligomer/maltooligosaccharide transport system permease protein